MSQKQEQFTGIVTNLVGNQIYFKTKSAANYRAETGSAVMVRKNGSNMAFEEIIVGDKVEVKGKVWNDNSINASYVRNLSLYSHNSTFKGKVIYLAPHLLSFTIESKKSGKQNITTNKLTAFNKGSVSGTFGDVQIGVNVTVKGTWDRSFKEVLASEIKITSRQINIEITGKLTLKNQTALTVVGENNVIYGIDTTQAKLKSKNNKPLTVHDLNMTDTVKVKGKHLAESVQIYASEIKDLSVLK